MRLLTLPAALLFLGAQEAPPPGDRDAGILGAAEPLLVTRYAVEVAHEGPAYQATAELSLRNPRSATIEGVAWIPVAPGAVPRGFQAANGAAPMRGVVRSRERAVDVYRNLTRAARGGRDPVILEQIGDRWLRATIAPVLGDARVELSVGYLGFSEKLGSWREVVLPSERTALRSIWSGSSRRLLAGDPSAPPITTWAFRAPGADGHFCIELDPSRQLGAPLSRATCLLILETPDSTASEFARQGAEALRRLVAELGSDDRVELYMSGASAAAGTVRAGEGRGLLGDLASADEAVRARLEAALAAATPTGFGHLDEHLRAALALAAKQSGDVRIVVASAQRALPRVAGLLEATRKLATERGTGFGLFTLALGPRADASSLADLARAGHGRAFSLQATTELEQVAPALVDAARHAILLAPDVTVMGATEVIVESKRHLTFGETVRVTGRYGESGAAAVRLEGRTASGPFDQMWTVALPDEDVAHPWVATLWAGQRAGQLRGEILGTGAQGFVTRLCERFGLLGPETVSLGLEPALAGRLPPLMGAPLADLDSPTQPLPPSGPSSGSEEGDTTRDPRRSIPTTLDPPVGGGSPLGLPNARPTAPSLPSPTPTAPRVPPGRGGGH